MVLLMLSVSVMYASEQKGNPNFTKLGVTQAATATQAGGNMEGKETRFGISASVLWATVTTDTSCGAVNAAHDSLTPLAGGMAMLNIALGEVVFGGVGVGIMGLLVNAILAVFIAGLMVGRTPEYLGKKIEGREMKLAVLAVLYFCVTALGFAALASVLPAGYNAALNPGPHGLSEILYGTHLTDRQQRQRLCRSHRQWQVLGHDRRPMHDVGPLLLHHPVPRAGQFAWSQEVGAALERHLPHHGSHLRRAARGGHPHRRRAHVLPSLGARPDRRALH